MRFFSSRCHEEKRSEVDALQHRVRASEEEYEKTKEVTQAQKMSSDTQIEKMERELSRMRAGLADTVQLLEQVAKRHSELKASKTGALDWNCYDIYEKIFQWFEIIGRLLLDSSAL